MRKNTSKYYQAIQLFDDYNSRDPKLELIDGRSIPANLLYAQRMSDTLMHVEPNASEQLKLAARSQHIGRWEIPRSEYPMDRNGYLRWRSQLKIYHAKLAEGILLDVGYDEDTIGKVTDLLLKKQLKQNKETQMLEDVICLVFLEFYFDDFSADHGDEKLVKILQKTIKKMSSKGVEEALKLTLSGRAKDLIAKASR